MHQEPDVGFDPGSPGSHPGPKAGAKPLRHPGIPPSSILKLNVGISDHHPCTDFVIATQSELCTSVILYSRCTLPSEL